MEEVNSHWSVQHGDVATPMTLESNGKVYNMKGAFTNVDVGSYYMLFCLVTGTGHNGRTLDLDGADLISASYVQNYDEAWSTSSTFIIYAKSGTISFSYIPNTISTSQIKAYFTCRLQRLMPAIAV